MHRLPTNRARRAPHLPQFATGIGVFLLVTSSYAAPAIECPQSIPEQSVRLFNTPSGWSAFVRAPLYLHSAAPMSGSPEQLGELADYKQKMEKGGWKNTYRLDGRFPDGKWLACAYGESNQVVLSQKLDDNTRACTITFRKGEHVGESKIAIKCR